MPGFLVEQQIHEQLSKRVSRVAPTNASVLLVTNYGPVAIGSRGSESEQTSSRVKVSWCSRVAFFLLEH